MHYISSSNETQSVSEHQVRWKYLLLLVDPPSLLLGVHYFPFIFGGALLCQFSGIFLFILPFNGVSCVVLNLLIGFSPTMVFSAILVKTHLIHTIFIKRLEKNESSGVKMQICPLRECFPARWAWAPSWVLSWMTWPPYSQIIITQQSALPTSQNISPCIFSTFPVPCMEYWYLVRNVPRS